MTRDWIGFKTDNSIISLASGLNTNYHVLSAGSAYQKIYEIQARMPGQDVGNETQLTFWDGNPASGNGLGISLRPRSADKVTVNYYDLTTGSLGIRSSGLTVADELRVTVTYQQ